LVVLDYLDFTISGRNKKTNPKPNIIIPVKATSLPIWVVLPFTSTTLTPITAVMKPTMKTAIERTILCLLGIFDHLYFVLCNIHRLTPTTITPITIEGASVSPTIRKSKVRTYERITMITSMIIR